MKKLTFALLLSLVVRSSAFAQTVATTPAPAAAAPATATTADEPETLVSRHENTGTHLSGWFLAPTFATTSFNGRLAMSPGLRGGIYLNRRFAVGVALNGLGADDSKLSSDEFRNVGAYQGLLLQYVVHSNSLLHVSVESTMGNGRWCVQAVKGQDECTGRSFLVFEPVANVELNIARHVRVASGVGYRFAAADSGVGPGSREMSGLVARTSLVFGSF